MKLSLVLLILVSLVAISGTSAHGPIGHASGDDILKAASEPALYTTSTKSGVDREELGDIGGFGAADLPVSIVQTHEHVFKYWLKAAEKNIIPKSGNTLIHFDSHPDFGSPKGLFPDSWPSSPSALEDDNKITLSDFILAGVWIGLFDRVIWVYPDWCFQIEEMWHDFNITFGQDFGKKKPRWRIDLFTDYFLSSNESLATEKIQNPKQFWFRSVPFSKVGDAQENSVKIYEGDRKGYPYGGLALPRDTNIVVDIDEDFFATMNIQLFSLQVLSNSFKSTADLIRMFSHNHLCMGNDYKTRAKSENVIKDALSNIARNRSFNSLDDFMKDSRPIIQQFCDVEHGNESMRQLFHYFNMVLLPRIPARSDFHELMPEKWKKFILITTAIQSASSLPQNREISSRQVRRNLRLFEEIMVKLLGSSQSASKSDSQIPKVITIARSIVDGFCPRVQWPVIENGIVSALKTVWGTNIKIEYDESHDTGPPPAPLECGSVKEISKKYKTDVMKIINQYRRYDLKEEAKKLEEASDWCDLNHDEMLDLWLEVLYLEGDSHQYSEYSQADAPYAIPMIANPFDEYIKQAEDHGDLRRLLHEFGDMIEEENKDESDSSNGEEGSGDRSSSEREEDSDDTETDSSN